MSSSSSIFNEWMNSLQQKSECNNLNVFSTTIYQSKPYQINTSHFFRHVKSHIQQPQPVKHQAQKSHQQHPPYYIPPQPHHHYQTRQQHTLHEEQQHAHLLMISNSSSSITNDAVENDYDQKVPGTVASMLKSQQQQRLSTNRVLKVRQAVDAYLHLIDNSIISIFLQDDDQYRHADKYLLAMVLIYLIRAKLREKEYSSQCFFLALWLAHDSVEEDLPSKYSMLPWAFNGISNYKQYFRQFLLKKNDLWARLNFRSRVSKEECDELILIRPQHWIWSRDRSKLIKSSKMSSSNRTTPSYSTINPFSVSSSEKKFSNDIDIHSPIVESSLGVESDLKLSEKMTVVTYEPGCTNQLVPRVTLMDIDNNS